MSGVDKDPFFKFDTIYGAAGEHREPYMTRVWIGRLRLHVFHRGDNDPDPHDHPWGFWTFPLTPYVEEVTVRTAFSFTGWATFRRVVPAWRWSFRPATHTHRVLGRWSGAGMEIAPPVRRPVDGHYVIDEWLGSVWVPTEYTERPAKIVTIVWRGRTERRWGFLKTDSLLRHCWVHWRDYVYRGGKHAPCE